jgi:dTDP-D-glucose 4,6-dehydratase
MIYFSLGKGSTDEKFWKAPHQPYAANRCSKDRITESFVKRTISK